MRPDQIFIGSAVAVLCLAGFFKTGWLIEQTRKGQRLADWFGEQRAPWVIRGLFVCGIVFGTLLATGVVNPVQW